MRFKFLLLSGKMNSGKDTLADFLVERWKFQKLAYADELKYCVTCYGWDGQKDERGRKLLQAVGQAFRAYNENVWVDALIRKIKNMTVRDSSQLSDSEIENKTLKFVISDVRFANEIEYFKDKIFEMFPETEILVVRVNRNVSVVPNDGVHNDISETELDKYDYFDYYIENNCTVDELHGAIVEILKEEEWV